MSRRDRILQMLQEDDSDPFLHYGLALEDFRENETQSGLAKLRKLVERFPDYVPAWFQLGQKLAAVQETEEAAEALRQGIVHATAQNDAHAVGEMREFLDSLT